MSASPLRAVLAAVDAGAVTTLDLVRTTGLAQDVVVAAVAHLRLIGRLPPAVAVAACPTGATAGCQGCAVTPGCPRPLRAG